MRLSVGIGAKNQLPEAERVFIIIIFFFFSEFKLNNKHFMFLFFFCFLLMKNLGAMADSRYTGFREITDRDVLDLQCTYDKYGMLYVLFTGVVVAHSQGPVWLHPWWQEPLRCF